MIFAENVHHSTLDSVRRNRALEISDSLSTLFWFCAFEILMHNFHLHKNTHTGLCKQLHDFGRLPSTFSSEWWRFTLSLASVAGCQSLTGSRVSLNLLRLRLQGTRANAGQASRVMKSCIKSAWSEKMEMILFVMANKLQRFKYICKRKKSYFQIVKHCESFHWNKVWPLQPVLVYKTISTIEQEEKRTSADVTVIQPSIGEPKGFKIYFSNSAFQMWTFVNAWWDACKNVIWIVFFY